MDAGRREKRTPTKFKVLLSNGEPPISSQPATTENANSYGLRVRTRKPWKPDTQIIVRYPLGLWVTGRVVYCQTLRRKFFAVGIEFLHRQLD